jgi:multidrug transporter EmrE-like cation transporter
MRWIYISAALIFETCGFIALKSSDNLTKTVPILLTILADLTALAFFVLALKKFEASFVYMIAAGLGTSLVIVANIIVFKQIPNSIQIISIILIIIGAVGLQSQGGTN